jgi:divalent metal cation (Fe/Co/Zn/Cd) transporter
VVQRIRALGAADPAVERVVSALTMHLGPRDVLLTMDVQFRKSLTTAEVEAAVDRLERAIKTQHPGVTRIFIEAESLLAPRRAASGTAASPV